MWLFVIFVFCGVLQAAGQMVWSCAQTRGRVGAGWDVSTADVGGCSLSHRTATTGHKAGATCCPATAAQTCSPRCTLLYACCPTRPICSCHVVASLGRTWRNRRRATSMCTGAASSSDNPSASRNAATLGPSSPLCARTDKEHKHATVLGVHLHVCQFCILSQTLPLPKLRQLCDTTLHHTCMRNKTKTGQLQQQRMSQPASQPARENVSQRHKGCNSCASASPLHKHPCAQPSTHN